MKKLILIFIIIFVNKNLYSQTKDTTNIVETIESVEKLEETYLYRIIVNQNYDGFNDICLIHSMIDFFQTKIEYDKMLNQFMFVSTKDVDESYFNRIFNQQVLKYKKVVLSKN